MKYYAICDVYGERDKLEIREYVYMTHDTAFGYYAIYDDELQALKECNELNIGMDAEYKCVVVEIEV